MVQELSLVAILSISGCTSTFLNALVCSGKPKYLQGKALTSQGMTSSSPSSCKEEQATGQIAHLEKLVTKPKACAKAAKIRIAPCISSLLGLDHEGSFSSRD